VWSTLPQLNLPPDDRPTITQWLRRPESDIDLLSDWVTGLLGDVPPIGLLTTLETEARYAGYMEQQERQIGRMRAAEQHRIPSTFSYRGVPGLSREVQDKLERVRPGTLGQAGRIPGVTPAAISVLDVYLRIRPDAHVD
jgi:tRNA uridine 5-carboxymethylaminomethyl modification enzyme